MELLLSICLSVAFLNARKENKNILNPSILCPGLWLVIVILGDFQLFTLKTASETARMCIGIGVASFVMGSLTYSKFFGKYKIRAKYNIQDKPNYNLIYFMSAICIVYFLPRAISSINVLLNGNKLSTIRNLAQGTKNNTGFANFWYNFIVLPSAVIIEPLAMSDFWQGKKSTKIFVINLLIVFLRVIADGGRTPLFNLVLYMLVGYYLFKDRKSKKIIHDVAKKQRKIKRYGLLAVILLGIVSLSRSVSTIWRLAYFYFAMSPILLTNWLRMIDTRHFLSYGLTSLNGFIYPITYIIKNLLRVNYPKSIINAYYFIAETDSTWLLINGQGTDANAYVSMFTFFYADARWLGVVLGSFLYGFLMQYLYTKMQKNKKMLNISLYMLAYQGLFFSFIRFPFVKGYYCLAYLFISLVAFRINKRQGGK